MVYQRYTLLLPTGEVIHWVKLRMMCIAAVVMVSGVQIEYRQLTGASFVSFSSFSPLTSDKIHYRQFNYTAVVDASEIAHSMVGNAHHWSSNQTHAFSKFSFCFRSSMRILSVSGSIASKIAQRCSAEETSANQLGPTFTIPLSNLPSFSSRPIRSFKTLPRSFRHAVSSSV